GQLFFDIGIGLSASVLFSLFAALTLVPMLSGLFLNQAEAQRILQGMGNNEAGSSGNCGLGVSPSGANFQEREQGAGGERRNNPKSTIQNPKSIDPLLIASDEIIPNPTKNSSRNHNSSASSALSAVNNLLQNLITKISSIFLFFQRKFEKFLLATVSWSIGVGRKGRRLIVLAIPITLLFISVQLLPPADYLPEGNRNLILWLAEPFPGTSIPEA
ncbi:MAG: hypothetical protein AAF063_37720, partial [Cyanobacteria bacterium J06643_5]